MIRFISEASSASSNRKMDSKRRRKKIFHQIYASATNELETGWEILYNTEEKGNRRDADANKL